MLLRRISQGSDFQGPAPLDEKDTSEDVLQLIFGTVDEVESMRFPAALALEQPLLVFYSASPLRTPIWSPFPAQNETLSVDFFVRHSTASSSARADNAAEYALRVQSFAAGGEFVEFQSLLPRGATIASCTEMTLTLQEPRAKVDRCNRKCACVCVLTLSRRRTTWSGCSGRRQATTSSSSRAPSILMAAAPIFSLMNSIFAALRFNFSSDDGKRARCSACLQWRWLCSRH